MLCVDNRRRARAEADFPVIVKSDPATSWVVQAVNVSQDGILIRSGRPLPLDLRIAVGFPFQPGHGLTAARVLRSNGQTYACQFVHIPANIHEALGRAVRKYSHQRWPTALHAF